MSVAKSYASAFLESSPDRAVLLKDRKALIALVDHVEKSKDLRVMLMGQVTSSQEKTQILEKLASTFGFSATMVHFLTLLARKQRLSIISAIQRSLEEVSLESEGGILGELTSAEKLDAAEVATLAAAFSKKVGKKVELRLVTDANLLAGLKVTVGGVTYDGTLRSQLDRLHQEMAQGGLNQ